MRLTRLYTPTPLHVGALAKLTDAGAQHATRVLRLRVGAPLIVFDGQGAEHRAEIAAIERQRVTVNVGEPSPAAPESPLSITLAQGVARAERMDWALQKAVELGVARIAPLLTARSVVRLDDAQAAKRLDHWRNVVIGACEQCGRARLPEMLAPTTLDRYLAASGRESLRLALDPTASLSLAALPQTPSSVELLIGPEGGLDDVELQRAQAAGFVSVRLGPRVLRTESAAIVALSVLQARWGDLR